MSEKKRILRGEAGGLFVPHPLVDEVTIQAKIKAGEWSEVEDKKPAAKKAAASKKDD